MIHRINYSKDDIEFTKCKGEDTIEYDRIKCNAQRYLREIGKPELPIKIVRLLIPTDQDVDNVNVTFTGATGVEGKFYIFPVQPDIPTSDNYVKQEFIEPIKEIYESDDCYPKKAATVINQGYFDGDKHIVMISVCPIQYYPKSGRIIINTSVELGLRFKSGEMKVIHHGPRSPETEQMYENDLRSLIDNPEMINSYSSNYIQTSRPLSKVNSLPFHKYIIITPNYLQSYFDKFIAWKKRKGIDIGLVTSTSIILDGDYGGDPSSTYIIGDYAARIRHYLSDAYQQQGTVYALLAGDYYTDVFIRYGCGTIDRWGNDDEYKIPTDLYFAEFNGDWNYDGDYFYGEPYSDLYNPPQTDKPEYYPDIYIGRLLCRTGQDILNWTDKIIKYEQNPGNGDLSYLTRSFMVEADEMADEDKMLSVIQHFPASFSHDTLSEQPSGLDANPTSPLGANVINQMNYHYGIYSLFCHGNPRAIVTMQSGYDSNSFKRHVTALDEYPDGGGENGNGLDNLTNENYPSLMYSIGCNNSPFDHYDPFGDWPQTRNMAHGFTVQTEVGGPAFLGNSRLGFVDTSPELYQIFADKMVSGSTNLGRAELLSKAYYGDHYLSYSHNLIGCPETQMWTATPSTFSSVSVTDNGSSITINAGVSGCTIAVCSGNNGADCFLVEEDVSSYTFSTSTRPLYITITKQNYLPYTAVTSGTFTTNELWFEKMKVLGNVTINSGATLTIAPGANISFASGASLNVNGVLNAQGTESQTVTFTSVSGTSAGSWGSINFYGSGASGSKLEYCTIQYATQVYAQNVPNILISHCTIQNTVNGVRYSGTNGWITNCIITDPSDHRIIAENGATAACYENEITKEDYSGFGIIYNGGSYDYCWKNNIYGFNEGLGALWGSSPTLGHPNNGGINNHITGCNHGLEIRESSYPLIGCSWDGGVTYGNSIHMNDSYAAYIYNCSSNPIFAQEAYWGTTIPVELEQLFYLYNVYYFGYSYPLSDCPWTHMSKRTSLAGKSEKLQPTSSSISNSIKANNDDVLSTGIKMRNQGKYVEAIEYFKSVIAKRQDNEAAYIELYKTQNDTTRENIKLYLASLSEEAPPIAKLLLSYIYLNAGNIESAKNINNTIIKQNADNKISMQAKLNNFYIALYNENNPKKASSILSEILDKQDIVTNAELSLAKQALDIYNGTISVKEDTKTKRIIKEENENIIDKYDLSQNYPNPFNPSTVVNYQLPEQGHVNIKVYDMLGRKVATLVDEMKETGRYSVNFDGSRLSSGVYFIRMNIQPQEGAAIVQVKKMLLTK